jgi:hypothetical protein
MWVYIFLRHHHFSFFQNFSGSAVAQKNGATVGGPVTKQNFVFFVDIFLSTLYANFKTNKTVVTQNCRSSKKNICWMLKKNQQKHKKKVFVYIFLGPLYEISKQTKQLSLFFF